MALPFTSSPNLTIGVEVELQIVDRRTLDLAPAAPSLFERLGDAPGIKPEIFQSMLEINTGICADVHQVRADLERALTALRPVCDELGVELASAGSHPFARYAERTPYPADRYRMLIDRNRWIARRIMIFGLHVHIGMRDREHAMAMINALLGYLPHALALSASSPYWQGEDTGLATARATVFEALPTAGHPCTFESWQTFEAAYDAMIASGSITSIKDLWWDIRPNPDFGTVEIRVCDALPTVSETVSLVAFVHSLAAWLDGQYQEGRRFLPPPYWLIRENKWRAARWGVEAEFVVDEAGGTRPFRAELERLLDELKPAAQALGCLEELQPLARAIDEGPSYRRQRHVFEQNGSLPAVVESLVRELRSDRPDERA